MKCKANRKNCLSYIIGNPETKTQDQIFYSMTDLKAYLKKENLTEDQISLYRCDYRYPPYTTVNKCPECGRPRRCENRAIIGYSVCKKHGAGNPKRGQGSAPSKNRLEKARRLTDGRGGAFGDWQEIFDEIFKDKQLTIYENDLAQAEFRIRQLTDRVKKSPEESETLWKEVRKAFYAYKKMRMPSLDEETELIFERLNEIVTTHYTDAIAWDEINNWIGTRNKILDSRNRHEARMKTFVSIERFHEYTKLLGQMFVAVLLDKKLDDEEKKAEAVIYHIENFERRELELIEDVGR